MAKKKPEYRRFECGIVVKQLPSVDLILKHFNVDLERGLFFHKPIPGNDLRNKNWCVNPAGNGFGGSGGYITLKVDGIRYQVHRLIWKVATGRDPRGVIDHINGMRDDNRVVNLRDVMPVENARNSVDGRWLRERERRAAELKRQKRERVEAKERAMLAKLKAKYESDHRNGSKSPRCVVAE